MIEVDGPIHNRIDRREHDQQRSGVIEDFGIMIIRFSNDEIRYHLKQVLKKIEEVSIMRTENKVFPASSAGKGSPSPPRGGPGKGPFE